MRTTNAAGPGDNIVLSNYSQRESINIWSSLDIMANHLRSTATSTLKVPALGHRREQSGGAPNPYDVTKTEQFGENTRRFIAASSLHHRHIMP